MTKILLLTIALSLSSCASMIGHPQQGIISKTSHHSVKQTLRKAMVILKKKGLKIFKVVRHHRGAKKVGLKMPQTVLIVFGNPKLGTPLMIQSPSMALDLPQKMLIRDENEKTIVSYNDPKYLQKRHHLKDSAQLKKIAKALDKITDTIVK